MGYAEWPADERDRVHVVFSAHSLPVRIMKMGDPYDSQLRETARVGGGARPVCPTTNGRGAISRPGAVPNRGLGPQLPEHLLVLAEQGIKNVISIPVGFVADHVEILYDIDIQAQQLAAEHGMRLVRPPALNVDPLYIETLADLIRLRHSRGSPKP